MMNCLKCPYAKRHDTKLYCPFFELRECPLMGEHYIPLAVPQKPAKAIKKVTEKVEAADTQPSHVPTYKPMHKTGAGGVIPWESLHERIFESLHLGQGIAVIASEHGLQKSTLRSYLRRYGYYDGDGEKEK